MLRQLPRPWIIAHRGIPSEVPENTLAGFEEAIKQGADLIELDVHQTADGHIVVIHDEMVDRTTDGTGPVSAKRLAELKKLDAGIWMGHAFAGQRIPTLLEVLDLTDKRVGLVIEIKVGSHTDSGIEAAVVALLRRSGRLEDVLIISGDCAAIKTAKRLEPRLSTLCFQHASVDDIQSPTRHSDALFAGPDDVSAEMVQEAHSHGLYVLSSLLEESVINSDQLRRLQRAGIDGVFANDAGLLRRLWGR